LLLLLLSARLGTPIRRIVASIAWRIFLASSPAPSAAVGPSLAEFSLLAFFYPMRLMTLGMPSALDMACDATRCGLLPPARHSCNVAVPRHRIDAGGGVGAVPPPRNRLCGGPLTITIGINKPVTRPHSEVSWQHLWGFLHTPALSHVLEAVQRLGVAAGGAAGGFATGSLRHPCIREELKLIHLVAPSQQQMLLPPSRAQRLLHP
jgi:hypothetical protein